ncbi:hypothetical protein BaRGS_00000224 [Batillaria attramentaria]|uniref:Uncharacterized protein n=1 Tax=Batillaria attramentaria TaxID=370345 RepID=A0ABD0M9W2_9CAEN
MWPRAASVVGSLWLSMVVMQASLSPVLTDTTNGECITYESELKSRPDLTHRVMYKSSPLPPGYIITSMELDASRQRSFYWYTGYVVPTLLVGAHRLRRSHATGRYTGYVVPTRLVHTGYVIPTLLVGAHRLRHSHATGRHTGYVIPTLLVGTPVTAFPRYWYTGYVIPTLLVGAHWLRHSHAAGRCTPVTSLPRYWCELKLQDGEQVKTYRHFGHNTTHLWVEKGCGAWFIITGCLNPSATTSPSDSRVAVSPTTPSGDRTTTSSPNTPQEHRKQLELSDLRHGALLSLISWLSDKSQHNVADKLVSPDKLVSQKRIFLKTGES